MNDLQNDLFTEGEYKMQKPNEPLLCGICGKKHSVKECSTLKLTNHIPDKIIPSKARLTLPDSLEVNKLCDGSYNVYPKCSIETGTRFGPFQAKKLFTLPPSIDFPLKIFTNSDEDLSEYFLDTSDENECSWMVFIQAASTTDEQNIICYQDGEFLYYAAMRDIHPGEPLKVWYSQYYASKMKRPLLNYTTTEIEDTIVNKSVDLEAILRKAKNITPRDSWSCKFCGKVERELSVFATHLLDHYKVQASRICAVCKDSFLSRRLLKKHLKIVHANDIKQTTEIGGEKETSIRKLREVDLKDTSVGGPLLLNGITAESADSLDNSGLLLPQTDLTRLNMSGMDNQSIIIEAENLNFSVDNIINENVKQLDHFNFELNEPESEQLICDICLKSFVKLKSLILHIQQHTGTFFCQACNKVFTRKENLTYHACNVFYKLKCPQCDKIFFQQKYLTYHIKAFHQKQFTCEKCSKFYESKQSLDNHVCQKVPVHKREKFPCSICSKSFFNKKNLYEHVKRHTQSKEIQKFTCEICNKTLSSWKCYLNHVKLHGGQYYPCGMCPKVFNRADSLKSHNDCVHNQKQADTITCGICDKTVKSKKSLQNHIQIHSDKKSYKCEVCQASFKQRSNLKRHANKHKSSQMKLESLFKADPMIYSCPKCNKNMKLKSSLLRHMKCFHPNCEISPDIIKQKLGKFCLKNQHNYKEREDESVMDLKETLENMNFDTDAVNNCSDINIEIDKILNSADSMDKFLSDSNDRIMENLINITKQDNELNRVDSTYAPKEVCLSMPDLTADQEIQLGENAYILDNGTIVEPQESPSKVVVYILDQNKFT